MCVHYFTFWQLQRFLLAMCVSLCEVYGDERGVALLVKENLPARLIREIQRELSRWCHAEVALGPPCCTS